jgi:DNA-binding MarR family transcriptional regulator
MPSRRTASAATSRQPVRRRSSSATSTPLERGLEPTRVPFARPRRARQTTSVSAQQSPPPSSPSVVLLTLAHRIESELGAALAPLGLTVSRLGLLGHISGVPGASFSELARMSGISVQSVHTAVKALVVAGLVRDGTARAGAASTIELTLEGASLLQRAMQAVSDVDDRLFGPDADPVLRQVAGVVRAAFSRP